MNFENFPKILPYSGRAPQTTSLYETIMMVAHLQLFLFDVNNNTHWRANPANNLEIANILPIILLLPIISNKFQ
jgi:hypothetical protein